MDQPVTVGDMLTAAANHPDMPAEHRNKFLDVLKSIGKGAAGIVILPVLLATGIEKVRDGHLEVD